MKGQKPEQEPDLEVKIMFEEEGNEGTGEGTETGTGTGQEGLWREQLPQNLMGNESFTSYKTLGDFAKSHLEIAGKVKEYEGKIKEYEGKVKDLEGRTANSIPKISDKSTSEEIAAYRKALGAPEKPEEYEFPPVEGLESSPEMISWMQQTFHRLGVPKSTAGELGKEWNSFVAAMVKAEDEMAEEERVENEKKFRDQFKSEDEYKTGMELAKRFWKKITNTDFDEAYKESEAWQVPLFMNFLFTTAQATGEDWSPSGSGGGGEVRPGMIYDKTPQHRR